jgi:hypothetical protein
MNLVLILSYLYPGKSSFSDYGISADENGNQFISSWNMDVPQPTSDELAAAEPKAIAWEALNNLKSQAQSALSASDITVLRLIEMNSTFVPAEWVTYRNSLRDIARATTDDPLPVLPVRPVYPAEGT